MSDEFGLAEPFDIDDGELDGLTPQQCFVLGVEWATFRHAMQSGDEIGMMIHAENCQRIKAMTERHGRRFTAQFHDDAGESWVSIHVEATK